MAAHYILTGLALVIFGGEGLRASFGCRDVARHGDDLNTRCRADFFRGRIERLAPARRDHDVHPLARKLPAQLGDGAARPPGPAPGPS